MILRKQRERFLKSEIWTIGNSLLKLCPDNLVLQISEFHYDPKVDLTFNNWFEICKDIFRKDLADIRKEKRVKLLLKHKKLKSCIRPMSWRISNLWKQYSSSANCLGKNDQSFLNVLIV